MDSAIPVGVKGEGFTFELVQRNLKFAQEGVVGSLPRVLKTGTTIVGAVFDGGVVLAADTRATEGSVVADKRCQKIHYIAPNVLCCGAGTAADTEQVTLMVSSGLTLHRLETRKQSRVVEALTMLKRHLYSYQGHVSAALVLGGVDVEGPFLATVAPHGSTDRLPFVAMGSGSLAAMGVLETGYKDGMTADDAKKLVTGAIHAGMFNDPFSGTQVDVCVITKDRVELTYGFSQPNQDVPQPASFSWSPKATFVPVEERKMHVPPLQNRYPRVAEFPLGVTPVKKEEVLRLASIETVPVTQD
jgi:20S proteasome subunit beta 2